jgi:hypothetical protein
MTNFKRLNTCSKVAKIDESGILGALILAANHSPPAVSESQVQLQRIKDIAELWLQAELDKRTKRKAELEASLADAFASLEENAAKPIVKLYRSVRRPENFE